MCTAMVNTCTTQRQLPVRPVTLCFVPGQLRSAQPLHRTWVREICRLLGRRPAGATTTLACSPYRSVTRSEGAARTTRKSTPLSTTWEGKAQAARQHVWAAGREPPCQAASTVPQQHRAPTSASH